MKDLNKNIKDPRFKNRDGKLMPREKAEIFGIETLSDEELICLLLGSGQNGRRVEKLAKSLVKKSDQLTKLPDMSITELTSISGIGIAKASALRACFELVKRCRTKKLNAYHAKVRDLILEVMKDMPALAQGEMKAVFLDESNQVCGNTTLKYHMESSCIFHPAHLMMEASKFSAKRILLLRPVTSPFMPVCKEGVQPDDLSHFDQDLNTIRHVKNALASLKMELADYVWMDLHSYFSFLEHHLLN